MKTTKREEFIKFLRDSGLGVIVLEDNIKCFYKDIVLFDVSDAVQFESYIPKGLDKISGELAYKVYSELRKYASLHIEDRFKQYEI